MKVTACVTLTVETAMYLERICNDNDITKSKMIEFSLNLMKDYFTEEQLKQELQQRRK